MTKITSENNKVVWFMPSWVDEEFFIGEGGKVPTFIRGYKFRPKIGRLADARNYWCAREQLWAMEVGLAEWPLPMKGKVNGK